MASGTQQEQVVCDPSDVISTFLGHYMVDVTFFGSYHWPIALAATRPVSVPNNIPAQIIKLFDSAFPSELPCHALSFLLGMRYWGWLIDNTVRLRAMLAIRIPEAYMDACTFLYDRLYIVWVGF